MTQTNIQKALRDSIQVKPDADQSIGVVNLNQMRTDILPPWGTRRSERMLRYWYRNPSSWMIQGAFAGLINKWLATPWTLDGAKTGINSAYYFDDILRNAEFGESWDALWSKVWLDFLRQDGGAYIEVIAPGDADKPIQERISGLAYLDSLRCYPTGDPEFPAIYYNRDGTKNKLHADRVIHLVDMPDGDEFNPGYGLCALRRAISIVEQQYLMQRYTREQLDELPPPGFATLMNMKEEKFLRAVGAFVERKNRDLPPAYGNLVLLEGLDADHAPKVEITSFSQAPEKFDYVLWVNLQVNALALVLGIDKQEIWELGGSSLGSGKQSEILHLKSQGKMFGHMLSLATRHINDMLPKSAELTFEPDDAYENQEAATTAQLWTGVVMAASADTSVDERRQMLANVVPQWKDVLTNAAGQVVKLPSDDAKPETLDVTLDDATAAPEQAAQGAPTQAMTTDDSSAPVTKAKDIQSTRLDFEGDAAALFDATTTDDVTRRRFGVILRDLVRKYGDRAFRDGLQSGGVEGDLDAEDKAAYTVLLASQSAYVTNLGDALFHDGATVGDSTAKASMWFNKSITPFFEAGRMSADASGMYEWVLGDAEHCASCLSMSGQKHRLKEYTAKGIVPKASLLDCGGWLCACNLIKTTGRSKGGWLGGE